MARLYRHRGPRALLALVLVTAFAAHAQPVLGQAAPAPASPLPTLEVADLPTEDPAEPVSAAVDLVWGPAAGWVVLSSPPPVYLGPPPSSGHRHSGFPDGVDRPPRPRS